MSYFPHLADGFGQLCEELKGQQALVLGHARPDGDCIGAQIALSRLFAKHGVAVEALNADQTPEALAFLSEAAPVGTLAPASLDGRPLVFVDCADERRIGPNASRWIEGADLRGNIDHHLSNTEFARLNVVDSTSAATCEIIAGLAFDFGMEVDAVTAQALLTGIMTDTGRFGYIATSSRVFSICSRLVESGAKPHVTAQSLYENEPISRVKLLQRYLGSLRQEFGGRLGIGILRSQDFLDTGATNEQTEGFVDFARALRGAKVGLYLEERPRTVKASLRAESADYRVDLIAKQFGGGGHACAAAFSSDRPIDELEKELVAAIGERIHELREA